MRRFGFRLFVAAGILMVSAQLCSAEVFSFKYIEGTKYKILSKVREQVYINDEYSHTGDILNKISVAIVKTKGDSGELNAQFITSERAYGTQAVYDWSDEYNSLFWRDSRGVFDIDPSYFVPTVRDVPQFPTRDVKPGETWSLPGEEVHDLRPNFHLAQPLRYPISVSYTYLGKATVDGREYDHIAINYPIFYKINEYRGNPQMHPIRVGGYSHQQLYWDNVAGRPYSYSEEFDIIFDFSTGDTVEYIGKAHASVVESTAMDKQKVADAIRKSLDSAGVANTEVKPVQKGVTISLEKIQFEPDSAVLLQQEKDKLKVIGGILAQYPDRDIEIVGHTALAGTAAGRQKLSLQRAQAVGDYLLSLGVRRQDQMIVKGVGASEPIADNSTEAGREKNRRVEITILEN
ncbi:MAG TPA: OmpA family protein [Spirochaetia bacterium]|nr:OmpA family protein [Spirochaetia bacterium]